MCGHDTSESSRTKAGSKCLSSGCMGQLGKQPQLYLCSLGTKCRPAGFLSHTLSLHTLYNPSNKYSVTKQGNGDVVSSQNTQSPVLAMYIP